jgi:pantetheine-phosphate adenylyltransferase, bacterial
MSQALIAGTFDPITLGHIDIIKRAANVFNDVTAVIFNNSSKRTYFTAEQRFYMLKLACADFPNVMCDMSDGLLAEYVISRNIDVIVKGVRDSSDFSVEYQMYVINNGIDNRIETFFIPSKPEHIHVSSTVVREFLKYNVDIKDYVSESVKKYIEECDQNK